MARGREVIRHRVVVIVDDTGQVAQRYAAHERALLGARDWITHRAIASEVRAENLSGSDACGGNGERASQRAVEVKNHPEAEMCGHIRVATERKLVGAIESGRAAEAARIVVVDRGINEILIGCGRRSAC